MATILCIEDDKMFAEIVCKALMRDGFEVIHATNGEEGVRKATEDAPDAILLDIGLPKKDGFEVLEILKSSDETKSIPVVMLSRLSSKEDVNQCFELGCEEYLIKTQHSPEDVVEHVRKILKLAPGFTVPEALAVVAVILILAGLVWWQLGNPKPSMSPESGNVTLEEEE
ncbi:MAG: response regulator [Candidatus Uhrbacteria bacterium]|nr:response regulator [Candidatus Uhrbacteria bacterium]